MPVYKLQQDMPYTELLKWVSYFKRKPAGWREDHRAALIMRSQGVKAKPEEIFPSLKVIKDYQTARDAAGSAMPSGKFLEKMLNAKNGDGSGWDLLKKGGD